MKMRMMIAAGGTGGHLFPGIAIAEEVKRRVPAAEIAFAGTSRGLEMQVLPRLGLKLFLVGATSIKDRRGLARVAAWARIPISVASSAALLLRWRPRLLFCVGGYAAGPLALAAWILRIPFVIMEPNAVAGFTNRILGRLCRRAFVQFDEALASFPPGRAAVTGNPVRREVLAARRDRVRPEGPLTVFAFGGSQGARRINRAMMEAAGLMRGMGDRVRFIHQTGSNDDPAEMARAYGDAGLHADAFAFTDRMWECYGAADLVVARAGATTAAELMALAMPSILVPYPFAADDHQRANARCIERLGGAVVIEDGECTGERLCGEIRAFVENPARLDAMRAALKRAGRPDASERIVGECLRITEADRAREA